MVVTLESACTTLAASNALATTARRRLQPGLLRERAVSGRVRSGRWRRSRPGCRWCSWRCSFKQPFWRAEGNLAVP